MFITIFPRQMQKWTEYYIKRGMEISQKENLFENWKKNSTWVLCLTDVVKRMCKSVYKCCLGYKKLLNVTSLLNSVRNLKSLWIKENSISSWRLERNTKDRSCFSLYGIWTLLLYPRHLCRRVYSFRLSFVCSFVLPSVTLVGFTAKCYVKVSQVGIISPTTHQKAFIFGP